MTGKPEGDGADIALARLAEIACQVVELRGSRLEYLPPDIFGEPAWDMLLDLFIASVQGKPISVSSVCIAARAPATTALRWLSRIEALGLVERVNDHNDGRRVYVRITGFGRNALIGWLTSLNLERLA